jgi:hypothetical protein
MKIFRSLVNLYKPLPTVTDVRLKVLEVTIEEFEYRLLNLEIRLLSEEVREKTKKHIESERRRRMKRGI